MEENLYFRLNTMFGDTRRVEERTPDALLEIAGALRGRTTSKATDEYICLAHLLGLDLEDIHTLPSSMDTIIAKIPLSPELIFLPGKRMTRKSFRWGPASLLEQATSSHSSETGVAELTERGLSLSKPAFVSVIAVTIVKNTRYILAEHGKPILMFKPDLADIEQLIRTSDDGVISRPVFILSFDFKKVKQSQGTVKGVLVEREGDSTSAAFCLNLVLVRTDFIDHITRDDDISVVYVPIVYRVAEQWTID